MISCDLAALGLAPGNYQIRGVLDRTGVVYEGNETDNASAWVDFSVDAPVVVEDFDPLFDTLAIHLNYDAGLPTPSGQLSYAVDAAQNRVLISIDGVERLILGNTQSFDPRWVTITVAD